MSEPTGLTQRQTEDYTELFRQHDRNNSGYITSDELGAVLRSLGEKPSAFQVGGLISDSDLDGDGRMGLKEFLSLLGRKVVPQPGATSPEEELAEAFRVHDADGDGFVTKDEMTTLMQTLGDAPTAEEIDAAYAKSDANGDGKLDFAEFKALYGAR
ncbi:EF-hand domain-containing protein [Longispora albida]|uniref:EF-hand domain-containing protein n=1 Tax=Longispora albida TaxID=203523 RepID=UPI00036F7D72|nr:EF-hand domain-containing protein [Longispora albida]